MYMFVYGTLRKGEVNHKIIQGASCLHEQAYVQGLLFDTEYGYPGLIENEKLENVYGELYSLPESLLSSIDELEGYREGRKDNLYDRVIRPVTTDIGKVEAIVYLYNDASHLTKAVDYQDWKVYQWLNNRMAIPYFAYGSCMDTERIRAAGMEEAFQQWSAASVQGYKVDYTHHRPDGARADILETGAGEIEGILYTTSPAAVDYLFKREGVEKGYYRPAFIEVTIGGTAVIALTFTVVSKQEPKAPPWHYAKEILRGAGRGLSESYQEQLYKRFQELNTELHPGELS